MLHIRHGVVIIATLVPWRYVLRQYVMQRSEPSK
jgi:hypothetical protein